MKPKLLAALLALLPTVGSGAISLVFSDFNNALLNLSDSAGTSAVNGLSWGIVIDTQDDDFASALESSVGLNMVNGVSLGSGYFFYYGGTTTSIPGIAAESGDGAVGTSASIDPYATPAISEGDSFAVIWFDSGLDQGDPLPVGSRYGLVTNSGYLLPADGSNNASFASFSAGTDPIRPTNLALVPEPSILALVGLSALGLLRRRR